MAQQAQIQVQQAAQTQVRAPQQPAFFLTEGEQTMVNKITAQLISGNAEKHELKGFFLCEEANSFREKRKLAEKNYLKHIRLRRFYLRTVGMHIIIGGIMGLLAGTAVGFALSTGMGWLGTSATVALFAIIGAITVGILGWIQALANADWHEGRAKSCREQIQMFSAEINALDNEIEICEQLAILDRSVAEEWLTHE